MNLFEDENFWEFSCLTFERSKTLSIKEFKVHARVFCGLLGYWRIQRFVGESRLHIFPRYDIAQCLILFGKILGDCLLQGKVFSSNFNCQKVNYKMLITTGIQSPGN